MMNRKMLHFPRLKLVFGLASTLLFAVPCWPQATGASTQPQTASQQGDNSADLAKKLSNPVADLVSVPFQFNWDSGVGPDEDTRFILNVQPVIPFSMTPNWNMILRVITPIISQPPLAPGASANSGIGDILTSMFLSPANPRRFTWGIGPVVSLPSTADPTLGTGKWSAGPTIVILKQSGGFTYGALWNQVWSFAGNERRNDVSQMFIQPFFSYTTKKAVTLTVNSETTANWKAESGQKWTIPITFQISKVSSFGPFPASYFIGAAPFVEKPDGGPSWRLRAGMALLLPRTKK
jgi:hypothetical protein